VALPSTPSKESCWPCLPSTSNLIAHGFRFVSRSAPAELPIKPSSCDSVTALLSDPHSRQAGHSQGTIPWTLLQQRPTLLAGEQARADPPAPVSPVAFWPWQTRFYSGERQKRYSCAAGTVLAPRESLPTPRVLLVILGPRSPRPYPLPFRPAILEVSLLEALVRSCLRT
jgi:hypothetical protein